MRVTLNRHGENQYGESVWTSGKYHIIRKRWIAPYAYTSYILTDTTNGKREGDFDTLAEIRDYIREARTEERGRRFKTLRRWNPADFSTVRCPYRSEDARRTEAK